LVLGLSIFSSFILCLILYKVLSDIPLIPEILRFQWKNPLFEIFTLYNFMILCIL
jgi:hypothetical protein